jgi:glucose-1-phosphate thymidylyltransferase
MDAIVLAGGYATRLWPITRNRPKMFLPIGQQTIIDRVLAPLEAHERIDDVYVSTNELFADDFRAHLAEQDYDNLVVSVEDTTAESEKFGVVGALAQLVEREDIDDDALVIAGDNLISFDISEFLDQFEANGTPTLAAYDVGSREKAKNYGLVDLDGDEVVDFQEKPADPQSTLVSIACYAFPADTLDRLGEYLDGDNNPDEPGWFLQWLQNRETVRAFTFDGAWFDVGTPEGYLDAVSWHLGGGTYVAESATLRDVDLGRNVHIMADVELENVSVTDAVIFPETKLTDTEIARSIVDRDATIEGIPLEDALISAHSTLTDAAVSSD